MQRARRPDPGGRDAGPAAGFYYHMIFFPFFHDIIGAHFIEVYVGSPVGHGGTTRNDNSVLAHFRDVPVLRDIR